MMGHAGSARMEVRLRHTVSPVILLAVISRKLELDGVAELDRRAIRGALTLHLDPGEVARLALAVRRGELPGVAIEELPPDGERLTHLVLTRRPGDSVAIGDEVELVIEEVRGNSVRIRFVAPRHIRIIRTELLE